MADARGGDGTAGVGLAADVALALLLFAAVALYLASLPLRLGLADEAYFLYEAKRLRDGEVMYRDVFQYVTPLSSYAMAALFWAFGTTMTTARLAMAAVHATTGVLLFAIARRLGVRREIAALGPLVHLAICQPAWPYASWHWFSTLFTVLLTLTLVATPWATRPRWALLPGAVAGLLIGTQQQRGVVVGAGVVVLLLADHLAGRSYAEQERVRPLAMRMTWFIAGVLAVLGPLFTILIVSAGAPALYDAMVRFPLESYRPRNRTTWGAVGILGQGYARYTMPAVLRAAPYALILPVAAALADGIRRTRRARVRELMTLVALAASSLLSIWYYPDLIHLAFVAPLLWLCAAVGLEWLLSALPRPRLVRLGGAAASAAVAAGLMWHLVAYARFVHGQFPFREQTAFGPVDFAYAWEANLVGALRELLPKTASGEMFCYPNLSAPYLTTGGRNPTPYQHFDATVFPRERVEEVVATLRRRRVPYVLLVPLFHRPDDPIVRLLAEEYEMVTTPPLFDAGVPGIWLYRRKDLPNPQ